MGVKLCELLPLYLWRCLQVNVVNYINGIFWSFFLIPFFYVCTCIWCASVCMSVYICAPMSMHAYGGLNFMSKITRIFNSSSTLFDELWSVSQTQSLWIWLVSLSNLLRRSHVSTGWDWDYRLVTMLTGRFCERWDLNLSSCFCDKCMCDKSQASAQP